MHTTNGIICVKKQCVRNRLKFGINKILADVLSDATEVKLYCVIPLLFASIITWAYKINV